MSLSNATGSVIASGDQASPSSSMLLHSLQEVVTSCSFAILKDSLRNHFLEGIVSLHLRECFLLEDSALSFLSAAHLAQHLEQAAREVQQFTSSQVRWIVSDDNRRRAMPMRPRSSSRRQPPPSMSPHQPPRRDSAFSRASRTPSQGQPSCGHCRSASPKHSCGLPHSPSFCFCCGPHLHHVSLSHCPVQVSAAFAVVGVAIFAPSATSCNTRLRLPWLKSTAITRPTMTKF